MKVLLVKDVYNLGRAGEIKKVANGFGRNFLIPQNLAMLATPGALKQADRIRAKADQRRNLLTEELATVAEQLMEVQLQFSAKAGETGKLYGSVTTQVIAKELSEKINVEISKRQIDSPPLRLLGMHILKVRLTYDLIPELSVVVYREGEPPENYMVAAEDLAANAEELVAVAEEQAAAEAEELAAAESEENEKQAAEAEELTAAELAENAGHDADDNKEEVQEKTSTDKEDSDSESEQEN